MRTRSELLTELIRNPLPEADLLEELVAYGWDSDDELVIVTKEDAMRILTLFRLGKLDASQVEDWANRIEGRDDIGYIGGSEGIVKNAISWLANPSLNWPIDEPLCTRIERVFASDGN